MELEAAELTRIAYVFDPNIAKNNGEGKCSICLRTIDNTNDEYCKECAVSRLRDIAKHLRTYL